MSTTYDNLVEQIAQAVFSTMLGIDLVRVDEPAPPDQELLLATVHIAGQWTGSVVLGLTPAAAICCAAAMLQMAEADVNEADERDVASELANMIGGNLKSVLPAPSYLSLPTIVSGREFGMHVRDAELCDDVVLACDAGLVSIRLYAKRHKADG